MADSFFGARGVGYIPPEWLAPTFAAGDYTASGSMTWTVEIGDVNIFYFINGRIMTISIRIGTTVIGGTASTSLYIKVPGGKTPSKAMSNICWLALPGPVYEAGTIQVINNDTKIYVGRLAGGNFPLGSNAYIWGQIVFEIQE